ncbi:MFS transporter [Pelosinus propionicus]|uniref:Sugar phosphate permease n=1 Tax=Pelosinus propionicus DSM 13327 TaxID=1123291 RepID=A0A1I4M3I8_9FIRM|nr:MFS transporter [Pelosinus propionicus]SFL97811.1 Sugar phosphate permease [Pelosinus propionicus DSM 13327]
MTTSTTDAMLTKRSTKQRWIIAGILMIIMFFSFIDRVNISILIADKEFIKAMGIQGQAIQMGMLMSSFLLAYGIGNIILSPLGDIIGPRKSMLIAVVFWAAAMSLGGIAQTFAMMIVARVTLGIFEGLHFPMQSTFVKNWFPPKERGRANAIVVLGISVAPAVAMPFLAWLVHFAGWRDSFFVLTVLGLIPLLLLWFWTTDRPSQNKRVNELELKHIEDGIAEEAKVQSPESTQSTEKETFWIRFQSFSSDYRFWIMVVYFSVHSSVFWGSMTWLPSYLKDARGFSWEAMGILSSLPWIVSILSKIFSGVLCDKLGPGRRARVLVIAMTFMSLGTYFGAKATEPLVAAILLGIGMGAIGMSGPASWTILQDIVPSKGVSTASGIVNGISNGVAALAPLMVGWFISNTGSYDGGLFFLVATSIVGGLLALVLSVKKN